MPIHDRETAERGVPAIGGTPVKYAGRSDTLFSDDATAAIHQASRGYPRAINNLAASSLIATYAAGKAIVDLTAAQFAITENSE